ncbi:predicted protein [Chaetomium globosum CBS 148.51]|uniref:Uncharacterized protein n=1 Tax=Chaetomium globosum (strain ATCC 6205 / CBS 148.51 / DSM 1962 / NBRC 6347 / NRRL 1970) TaxID=306901 RepID=Q2GYA4_CHAGB|nr:uncharacterized protein CHGG_07050 [Chaetomium globosum CBS 148.51]EAQ85797.1 predicted protein [Chaetomium globosum CBS 148.51]
MTGAPNRTSGQAPSGRSAAEIEAEIRAERARLAMEDDLGIARVEELPLETESRDRARGQHGRHAEANSRRGQPSSRGPSGQPSLPGSNGVAWGMDQVWQDAIAAKIFDDDEAETVKNLDDLGGGRLYDNAAPARPQKAWISHMTMRILNQRNARSGNNPAEHPTPNKGGRPNPNQGPAQPGRNNTPTAANSSSHGGNNKSVPAPSARSKHKAINVNPRARQVNQPRAQPVRASPAVLPMRETTINPNAPLSFETENVIQKVVVNFSSRDINPALPALILLSAAAPPELGFMTVVIYNNKYCEWPVSAWFDYSTGADNLLTAIFQNDGGQQGYGLQFKDYGDLVKFRDTVALLQAGKHPNQVGSASVPAPTVIRTPTPTAVATTARNTLQPEAPGEASNVGSMRPRAASPPVPTPTNVPSISEMTLVPAGFSEPTTPSTHPDVNSAETDPMLAFRNAAIITCRTLFQFFHLTGTATNGTTMTVEDMEQTAEGIRSGVLEHSMNTARAQGASEEQIQVIRDTINEYFRSQLAEGQRAVTNSRRVYSYDFLMSRRVAAISPKISMADIPDLPQLRSSSSRGRVSSRGRATPYQSATPDQPQISKSASAMQWVLSGDAPSGMPNTGADTTPTAPSSAQATVPSAVGLGGTPDTGLQNSRWASGGEAPKHANWFTGLGYEKAWSKRTYLDDLAQLDPNTAVTAGTEDIMDHYFPLPDASRAQPSPQASTVDGNRDNMEDLSVDMSRLSIQSPTAPPRRSARLARLARLAASAEASGYATRQYRELRTQPTSAGSTPSVPSLETQATSRSFNMESRATLMASNPSPVSITAQVPNGLRPAPTLTQTEPSTSAEPIRSASTQPPPAVPAQSPATTVARPGVRGLAASRHSDGIAPSNSGNFDFYLPNSARR